MFFFPQETLFLSFKGFKTRSLSHEKNDLFFSFKFLISLDPLKFEETVTLNLPSHCQILK